MDDRTGFENRRAWIGPWGFESLCFRDRNMKKNPLIMVSIVDYGPVDHTQIGEWNNDITALLIDAIKAKYPDMAIMAYNLEGHNMDEFTMLDTISALVTTRSVELYDSATGADGKSFAAFYNNDLSDPNSIVHHLIECFMFALDKYMTDKAERPEC